VAASGTASRAAVMELLGAAVLAEVARADFQDGLGPAPAGPAGPDDITPHAGCKVREAKLSWRPTASQQWAGPQQAPQAPAKKAERHHSIRAALLAS
jgi:hypothetical protein